MAVPARAVVPVRTPVGVRGVLLRAVQVAQRALVTFGSFLASGLTEQGFHGGKWSRLTADWAFWRRSADQEVADDLAALRARARNLVLNSPFVRRFVSQVATNVAGPVGIRFKGKVEASDGRPDLEANRQLEAAFAHWSRCGMCTVDGRYSRAGLERLICKTLPQDGEVFIRLVDGFPNAHGFALQILDADLCDHEYSRAAARGANEIRMGVEIDGWGRPLGYWFYTAHPAEAVPSRERVFLPAEQIIHLYVPHRPGQTRGVPWVHAVMTDLRHLAGYQEAELVAARIAAAKGGFFESNDEGSGTPVEGTGEDGRFEMEVEPGVFGALPAGMKFQPWDPTHPTQAYGEFIRSVLHAVAAGLDVSYHNLAADLSAVNYSSARVGELDERDHWRALQGWMIEHLHQRVYPRWLRMTLTSGALALPARDYERLQSVQWMPRGWAWVDPENELAAIETALKLRLTSRTQEAAAQGRDLEEIYADLQAEEALAAEYGLEEPDEPDNAGADEETEEERARRGNGNGHPPRTRLDATLLARERQSL